MLASTDEVKQWLAIRDDAAATAFIADFWSRRATGAPGENRTLRTFERRAAEADAKFSEAGYLGRRTDRGTIWVVYGPPTRTDHDVSPVENGPAIEVWYYDASAPAGLNGRRPQPRYRFIPSGDLTVFYFGQNLRTRPTVDPF